MQIKMKETKEGLVLKVKNFGTLVADLDSKADLLLFGEIMVNKFERGGRQGLVASQVLEKNFLITFDLDQKIMTLREVNNNNYLSNLIKTKPRKSIKDLLCLLYTSPSPRD